MSELAAAYIAWATEENLERRELAWDNYVDLRDGLEPGTTSKRRQEQEPSGDARVIYLDLDG